MSQRREIIETAFETRAELSPDRADSQLHRAIESVLNDLESGELRVAQPTSGGWQTNDWVRMAVLLFFRITDNQLMKGGYTHFYDKVPSRWEHTGQDEFRDLRIRVVPPAVVRRGAYVGPDTVLMPCYVNIGAYIGAGSMVDTWATVGSCAQIGRDVHISGGAGIGGVLEPIQATPTIIEDNCFIGARSEIVEGVIVEANSVISMGVFIGQSTPVYDRATGEIIHGRVPEGSVIVPGALPAEDGTHSLSAAIIVKRVDEKTRARTSINELLRTID
ncbi:MAG: 2,3,4,5-tetrahydropyridine-2,6-dicarboxylate N-succinyltransferase [Gammaproteobacteria bacterium]|nr:MAG: 2,3,4,5-tetrahydropyridine-2,6-dicarboxylate N-succinyltransferase [Gammaproteobacteria bacterium]